MNLLLQQYSAVDHTAVYERNGACAIEVNPHARRVGTPLVFGDTDGRPVGEILKVNIDERNNRAQVICRIDEPEAQIMVAEGCVSSLALPPRTDLSPYLTDIQQPPNTTFKYQKDPREMVLQKRFVPEGLNKRRQAALTEVYKARTSSPENIQNWRSGHDLRAMQRPVRKDRQNPNLAVIFGSPMAADVAMSRTDELLRTSAQQATTERRQNRNSKIVELTCY